MSDDVIISVEHLSKRYKLGQIGATTLRESAERFWHRLRGRDPAEHMGQIGVGCRLSTVDCKKESANPQPDKNIQSTVHNPQPTSLSPQPTAHSPQPTTHSPHSDDLWALRDVSFEVKRGEVLGIIGRNGAGKSTLLKILSRITEPTSGRAVMRGRIASLLEVGTGFHPELTGRENIYLNGAILGMRKREIDSKFDEIVAFSEVERFIDTPVKRYSSGMYVRLAFAVAAHLDPEILLVDEVLAVGDAGFQKKCMGKMGEVAKQGRTVLFVSHNMAAITTLCDRTLLLAAGALAGDGLTVDIVERYYGLSQVQSSQRNPAGDDLAELVAARIVGQSNKTTRVVSIDESIVIEMTYRIKKQSDGIVVPNFHVYTANGICCFVMNAPGINAMAPGIYEARCLIPSHLMNEGTFSVGVAATVYFGDRYNVSFYEAGMLMFTIRDPKQRDEHNYGYMQTYPGILHPRMEWNVRRVT